MLLLYQRITEPPGGNHRHAYQISFVFFAVSMVKHSSSIGIELGQEKKAILGLMITLLKSQPRKEGRDVLDRLWSLEHKIRFRIDTHAPNWLTV